MWFNILMVIIEILIIIKMNKNVRKNLWSKLILLKSILNSLWYFLSFDELMNDFIVKSSWLCEQPNCFLLFVVYCSCEWWKEFPSYRFIIWLEILSCVVTLFFFLCRLLWWHFFLCLSLKEMNDEHVIII